MNLTNTFLLLIFWSAANIAHGQTNFKADYLNNNPVEANSAVSFEEKVKLHHAFLEKYTQEHDTYKQFLGYIYLLQDHLKAQDYPEATRYLLLAEGMANAANNVGWLGAVNHQRGILNVRMQKSEDALEAYKLAAKQCGEAGDSLCLAQSLEQVSAMYGRLEDFKESTRYYEMALPLIEKFGGERELATTLNNQGNRLSALGRSNEAIHYIQKAITLYDKLGAKKEATQCLNNLADVYRRLGQKSLAIKTFEECIRINTENNFSSSLVINFAGLYTLFDEDEDYPAANEYLEKYHELRDSIMGVETQEKIAALEIRFKTQEKELELAATKATLSETKRRAEHYTLLSIFGILVALLGVLAWRLQIQRSKRAQVQNQRMLSDLTRILIEKNAVIAALEAQPSNESTALDIEVDADSFDTNVFNQRILTNDNWTDFKVYFEKAYPGFILQLRNKYPALTEAEERLLLLIKLNLTTKEVASMLGITVDSVKKTRNRLRKKLSLEQEEDLELTIRQMH